MSKISEREPQRDLGYSKVSLALLRPHTGGGVLEGGPGVGRRQGLVRGSSVSALAWPGWWHLCLLCFLPRVTSFHGGREGV